jgi:hypothetical protein
MKHTSFYYPYEMAFKRLQSILRRNKYIISSASLSEGKIKAHFKNEQLQKSNIINIKVFKIDEHETGIALAIKAHAHYLEKPGSSEESKELITLTETISNYL